MPDPDHEPMRKHRRPAGFVMLDNAAVNDDRLSFRARGLLVWLLGRPPGWAFNAERIARCSPTEGREAVLTALRELDTYGYVRRTRLRLAGGHLRTVTEVAELPELMPSPETAQPTPVEPAPAQPAPAEPTPKSGQTKPGLRKTGQSEATGLATRTYPQSTAPACGQPDPSLLSADEQQALRAAALDRQGRRGTPMPDHVKAARDALKNRSRTP